MTISNVSITGTVNGTGYGIYANATAANPITNLTIQNCKITGYNVGIYLLYVKNVTIKNCTITDAGYAGILIFSGIGGTIQGNTIQRIGVGIPLNTPSENNAYGIALTRTAGTNLVANPRSTGFLVSGNTITDVPLWHCLDTHSGDHIQFNSNYLARCPRPMFITTPDTTVPSQFISADSNTLDVSTVASGGTSLDAITLYYVSTGTFTNNKIWQGYGTPYIYDYLGKSTSITESGTTSFP